MPLAAVPFLNTPSLVPPTSSLRSHTGPQNALLRARPHGFPHGPWALGVGLPSVESESSQSRAADRYVRPAAGSAVSPGR